MKLIAGTQLRDPNVVSIILSWQIWKLTAVEDLVNLLWVEWVDAAFSRFNSSGKLKDPEYNPLEAFKNESNSEGDNPEEILFSSVFGEALRMAEGPLGQKTEALFDGLLNQLKKNTQLGTFAFVIETMLFHLDKKFNEEGIASDLVIRHCHKFLSQLDAFLSDENSGVGKRAWRESLRWKVRYVQEEAIIRKRGWFPPTQEVMAQAAHLLQGELAQGSGTELSPDGRSALRLLTDTPEMFLSHVVQGIQANPQETLGDDGFLQAYKTCAQLVVGLFDALPPPQP
jgi:hypothetical protein